jgi:hypothetical protein
MRRLDYEEEQRSGDVVNRAWRWRADRESAGRWRPDSGGGERMPGGKGVARVSMTPDVGFQTDRISARAVFPRGPHVQGKARDPGGIFGSQRGPYVVTPPDGLMELDLSSAPCTTKTCSW